MTDDRPLIYAVSGFWSLADCIKACVAGIVLHNVFNTKFHSHTNFLHLIVSIIIEYLLSQLNFKPSKISVACII